MKVATGRVVSGKVIFKGEPFPEGSVVRVVEKEDAGFFELAPKEEEALLEAIAEVDAGDVIDGEQFLRDLWNRR